MNNELASANALNIQLGLEKDRWRQIAIRERAKVLSLAQLLPDNQPIWPEKFIGRAADALDSEVKGIIIAEEGDVEALRDLSRIIELLKEGRTPAMMEEDLVRVEAAVKRWLKQLGGLP